MGFLIGAVIGTLVFSYLVDVIFLRKVDQPKKLFVSVLITFPAVSIIAAYGMADGGQPVFVTSFINYGIASVIVLALRFSFYKV